MGPASGPGRRIVDVRRTRRRGESCCLVAACLALLGLLVPAQAPAADAVAGRLIVGFRDGTSADRAATLVQAAGGQPTRRLRRINAVVVRPRARGGTSGLSARLGRLREVRYVEPDFYLRASRVPDDPFYLRQYALQSGGNGISAPTAWDGRTSCSEVATLDSGVQTDHPDLKGNIWHNPGEIEGNGKDDDHNGWVDDYYGVNIPNGSGSGSDADGHGTHVAGIIAGHGNNATGVTGACWSSSVMPVRFMDSHGRGSTSDAVTGLDYAIHEGAKVVNCSFGSSSKSSALQDAVDAAESKDVLLVVAAGNDGDSIESKPEYPASYGQGNILTVAATDANGALASFSNFGSKSVDLAAPGDSIYSTYPTSGYKYLSGTSMAAPLVAAAAAMLRKQDPRLSAAQIRSALKTSVDPVAALAGKTVTGGRLNLARALQQGG
jgi:subtilisin family serine protease